MSLFNLGMQFLFWLSLGLIIHTYFIYPVILFVGYSLLQLCRDWRYLFDRPNRRVAAVREDRIPGISVLIPAHNEQACLSDKIANIREMDYPAEKLQIIFISDGSTDATNEILKTITGSNIEAIILPRRGGKATALNHGVERARHELLVFSDASTLFAPDALRKLSRHFSDARVGAVCGALRFRSNTESQQTEGVYWKYESMIRLMEARLGVTMTASGAIYALRRDAYRPLDPRTVLDDFVIPMNARKAGYRVLYDPEAIATDYAAQNVKEEFTRRVRLATGSFNSLKFLLGVPMGAFCRFAFLSHKLLRWIVPLLMSSLLITNIVLIRQPFYAAIGLLQLSFYFCGIVGFLLRKRIQTLRFAQLPYFLLAMNLAFLIGLVRSLTGHEAVMWQRARAKDVA